MPPPRDRERHIEGRCDSAWCTNAPSGRYRHCYKCVKRRYKFRHTMAYAYNLLRCGAVRRGWEFTITFEDYRELWEAHPREWEEEKRENILRANHVQGRTNRLTWEVDRIDDARGYVKGNIQVMRKCMNVAKGNRARKWVFQGDGSRRRVAVEEGYSCPF